MLPEKQRRVRRYAPHDRDGCRTCKSRGIKCDKGKPICDRCMISQRECTYQPFVRSFVNQTLDQVVTLRERPDCGSIKSILPGAEGDLFLKHHFVQQAPWGHFSLASLSNRLWTEIVPGLSQGHKALDLAIHAFSALSYAILASRPRTDAYGYMDRALQAVKKQPRSYDFADVATSILCAHFENLSSDNGRESAMVHVDAASGLFSSYDLDASSYIGVVFLHDMECLKLEAAMFSPEVVEMSTWSTAVPESADVYDTLGVLVANTWNAVKVEFVPADKWVILHEQLQQWMIDYKTPSDARTMVQCIAFGHWHTAMLQLNTLLGHQRNLDHARAVLAGAEALCVNSSYRPLHHTNTGIVWPLFTTAILTESRMMREKSAAVLRRIGREGFHDGNKLAIILEKEMEQGGSVEETRERRRKLVLRSLIR